MQVKPGMAVNFAEVVETEILPLLLSQDGCQDARMLLAPGGRRAIGWSLWDHRDEAERHGRTTSEEVTRRLAEFLDDVSVPEVFQVWSARQPALFASGPRAITSRSAGRRAGDAVTHHSEAQRVEIELGREVQRRLYPRNEIALPGCDVAGIVVPAAVMCGDYCDHFPTADGNLGLAIGDVSGHGVGPSLIMVQTRAYLRSFSQAYPEISEVMQRLNATLFSDLASERFVTLLLLRLDLANRVLSYSNAGHLPGYLLDRQGDVRERLPSSSTPLGLFAGRPFPDRRLPLEPGDMIVLFTDGVTESSSVGGEEFGAPRALAFIKAHRHLPAHQLAAELLQAVRAFAGHAPQADDMSVLLCKLA